MLKSAWDKVVAATITRRFCTAGFKDEAMPSDNPLTAANEIMQPLLERLYQEMNISVSDVVDMNSDLETTTTPTDAEILGLPSCAPSASDESEYDDNCGDELERVTQSEVTSCLKVTQSEATSCLKVTQSEATSCLKKLNVYIMQVNCT